MRICECGNPRRLRGTGCEQCDKIDAGRVRQDHASTKAAAVLRFEDWLSSFEIRERAGFPPDDSSVSKALEYMLARGEVERRAVKGHGMEYRLKQQRRVA